MPSPSLGHRPSLLPIPPGQGRRDGAPRGFTLVELLVVIFIIALLMGLLTPVVMRSLTKARNAAIKAEIDMLHMAIMNYKNEYGSFPPCVDRLYRGPDGSTLQNSYTADGEASRHLRRLYPRCSLVDGQLNTASASDYSRTHRTPADAIWLTYLYSPNPVPPSADLHLNPHNAIVSWLSGFTSDPTSPLVPVAQRKPLYEFDRSRASSQNETLNFYAPSGKPGAPFIYIDSSQYNRFAYAGMPSATPGAELRTPLSAPPEFFNPDTFQILCAGRDETYGTGDDLSNFWPGTRQEYLDSLK